MSLFPESTHDVLSPLIEKKANKLADLPPGSSDAASIVAEILTLVKAIATDPAVSSLIPDGFKKWVVGAVAIITLLISFLGGFTTGRVSTPVQSPDAVVTTFNKITVYTTANDVEWSKSIASNSDLAKLATVKVDPKTYEVGSTYPWNGNLVELPCVAISFNGQVVNVLSNPTPEDLIALLMPKKK